MLKRYQQLSSIISKSDHNSVSRLQLDSDGDLGADEMVTRLSDSVLAT